MEKESKCRHFTTINYNSSAKSVMCKQAFNKCSEKPSNILLAVLQGQEARRMRHMYAKHDCVENAEVGSGGNDEMVHKLIHSCSRWYVYHLDLAFTFLVLSVCLLMHH